MKRERAQLAADARVWATAYPLRRKVVTVSSAQLAIDGLTATRNAKMFRDCFSWASEDYAAACRAPGGDRFWQSVKGNRAPQEEEAYKAALLDERFFVAGASARWMFAFTTADLRREVDLVIQRWCCDGTAGRHANS